MAYWRSISLGGMFSGLNPAMLKGLEEALKLSVKTMEKQVEDINKYIDTMIDPVVKLLEEKVNSLLDFMEAFNVSAGFYVFDSLEGKAGAQGLTDILNSIDFMADTDTALGSIMLVKTSFARQFEEKKEALENLFQAGDQVNRWYKKSLGEMIPFFNPQDAASTARQIIDKFNEILAKLKEKRAMMLEFVEKELQVYIDDAYRKIEEIKKLLDSLDTAGLYQCTFEGLKGKEKLVKDIAKSLEEVEGTLAPRFGESDKAAGVVAVLSADQTTYQAMAELFKKILSI